MEIKLCAFADEASAMLEGQIQALKRNGIKLIELRGIDGKNVSAVSLAEAEGCAQRLRESGIDVWSIGAPIGKIDIGGDYSEHLELARHVFRLAGVFGTDKIRVFSFYTAEHASHREKVFLQMRELVSLAAEFGVKLFHENEKGIFGDTAENVKDLLDNVKGLYSIYDPANYVQCGQNMKAAMASLAHVASYYHIKDALFEGGAVVPSGFGDGEIPALIAAIDMDAVLTLEPHLKLFEGYAGIDRHELKGKFMYSSSDEAFDAAANALKDILRNTGYKEESGAWIR